MIRYGIAAATIGLAVLGAWAQEEATAPAPRVLAEAEIANTPRPITVPVEFQGETYLFLLDTATFPTTFDESLKDKLEPFMRREISTGTGETREAVIYRGPDATFGEVNLKRGGPAICVDLQQIRDVTGEDIRGVIGMAVLKKFVLQLDFDEGKVRIIDPDIYERPEWGEAIDMISLEGRLACVEATLYDMYGTEFIIDTGYPDTGTIEASLFEKLEEEQDIKAVPTRLVGTIEGTFPSIGARVNEFKVGSLEYDGLIFDKSPAMSKLGLGFLARHKVTIDLRHGKLYLRKGERFDVEDQSDMSGLHLLEQEDRIVVHSVDEDSPAEKAGFKADDVILKIDDTLTKDMHIAEIRELFRSEEGRTFTIILKRGEQGYKTNLTLKKKL